ncbi:MAG: hypothetical protein ACREQ8_11705 [Woeseiaceae bacterium]
MQRQELGRRQRLLDCKRRALDTQIAALRSEFEAEEDQLKRRIEEEQARERTVAGDRSLMARRRGVDGSQSGRQAGQSKKKRKKGGTELRREP